MTTYVRLGGFESSSSPGVNYHVSTDGENLSCDCPGWTNQTHYSDCPAVIRGIKCTCRNRVALGTAPKESRTCKHLREVAPWVAQNGGITATLERNLYYAPRDAVRQGRQAAERLAREQQRVARAHSREEALYRADRLRREEEDRDAEERVASARRSAEALERLRRQAEAFQASDAMARRRRVTHRSETPTTPTPTAPTIPIATGERAIRIRREEDE